MNKRVKNELLMLCGLSAIALYATKNRRLSLIPAFAAGYLLTQKDKPESFRDQSVVITGGSRGLGLALAYQLVNENAHVTLIARDEDELKRAQKKLQALGHGLVHYVVCDVTDSSQLANAIESAAQKFDGIDMMINNAGTIVIGPWESMVKEDYESQMRIHLYSVVESTRLVLPYLRRAGSGKRIVNICSMGGKIAVPHMIPYDVSKFALSGFSQGVAAELYHEGISVTTIYPGPLRTGSPIQAVFKGDHDKEFVWFQLTDILPGLSTSVQSAAKEIIKAARERRFELLPFLPIKMRLGVATFFPELVALTLTFLNRLLPKGQSSEYKTGAQSRTLFDKSLITKPFINRAHRLEEESNQSPKDDPKRNTGLLH